MTMPALEYLDVLFSLVTLCCLIMGWARSKIALLMTSLWLSFAQLLLLYYYSGQEILGSYFSYERSGLYTLDLLVFFTALCLFQRRAKTKLNRRGIWRISQLGLAGLACAITVLLINLGINAWFLHNRAPQSPVLQVANMQPLRYCEYGYVYYKLDKRQRVQYLCPNRFGLIASTGTLPELPDFFKGYLPLTYAQK